MFSRCFHNGFIMLQLCLYYAFIMPTLRFYYIMSNNINIYIALSLESSRCGALWNRRDVVLFWNCLYRAHSLESSRCDALGIVAMCLSRESSRCRLFLESSL